MAKKVQTEEKHEIQIVRITRPEAANQVVAAINGPTTLSELAAEADRLFVEGGGTSKLKAAEQSVRRALETAESLGVVRLQRPTDLTVARVKSK